MLLEEYDPDPSAIIEPIFAVEEKVENFPETVVSVFSHKLFARLVEAFHGKIVAHTKDVDGVWNAYEVEYKGKKFALFKARLGAPACVGAFEDLIPYGVKRIVLLGNCGVLKEEIEDCSLILPTKALRDEGTSYHYLPPSNALEVNAKYLSLCEEMLNELKIPFVKGTTWTTDAFYRETRAKVENRKKMGAICVEMECAAMQAMCSFRGVDFFQMLYAGDSLAGEKWDKRSLSGEVKLSEKEQTALLAFELAWRMEEQESKGEK